MAPLVEAPEQRQVAGEEPETTGEARRFFALGGAGARRSGAPASRRDGGNTPRDFSFL